MFKKNLMTNIYIKFNERYFWTNQFLLAQKNKLSLTYVLHEIFTLQRKKKSLLVVRCLGLISYKYTNLLNQIKRHF